MVEPRKQWQENLEKLIEGYYRLDLEEKQIKAEKVELKNEILEIMKKHSISRFCVNNKLEAIYIIKKKLPSNISLIKKVLEKVWSKVASKKISYEIDRKQVEKLIKEGKVDKEKWEAILVPEETFLVKSLGPK